jgi:hypothetical protein
MLYAEADLPEEAANALLFHAARATSLEDRVAAYQDALRWLGEGHPRWREVQAQIGLAVLDDAQRHGARTGEEKRRLADAADRLEGSGRPADAATCFELLGERDNMARCLEKAGDIERLERLLEETSAREQNVQTFRALIDQYERSMAVGAREEARESLRLASDHAPRDRAVADLVRRFEARRLDPFRVEIEVDARLVAFVGRMPAVLGRTGADVVVRGASVSRRHAEIAPVGGDLVVRDLDSRNGTLVRGLPIAGEIALAGPVELGLGDDVTLDVRPAGNASVRVEVLRGLDRGAITLVGAGALRVYEMPFTMSFPGGCATLTADAGTELRLGEQRCALPIGLLADDEIHVGGKPVRVLR